VQTIGPNSINAWLKSPQWAGQEKTSFEIFQDLLSSDDTGRAYGYFKKPHYTRRTFRVEPKGTLTSKAMLATDD